VIGNVSWRRRLVLLAAAVLVVAIFALGAPNRAAAEAPCTADALTTLIRVQRADNGLNGLIYLTNHTASACALPGLPAIQMIDGGERVLPVSQTGTPGQPVVLSPGQTQSIEITWSNYCQQPAPPPPYSARLAVAGGGQIEVMLLAAPGFVPVGTPPACASPGAPSTLATAWYPPVAPPPPPAADPRYFPQTGFRIDNDVIWDYFNHRGGVATFGYPVSRAFLLQGFRVQFFQRRIVQLDQNGQARLLNLLDAGLMPYASFNYAAFPAYDAGLVGSAPSPADPIATLAFVRAHAPDAWNGLPVHFYQTFLDTVSSAAAFPNGGDAGLLPGMDLELWGLPTSNPAYDPSNHNFVYLRFQRGIMHYDAGCACTQAVLLADYLKTILTGQNLPADLVQEAQGSIFYRQYDPSQPHWVHDPGRLPNTDLTNAFTAQ
jgi:Protein of unknown function (DUF4232)